MNPPQIFVKIDASFGWPTESEDGVEIDIRHQQQHVLNAMALDLEPVVKQILEQMIFHRAKLDG